MLFLLLHVLLMSGFGLLLKDAKNRGQRLNPVGFFNYFVGLMVSIAAAARGEGFSAGALTALLGAGNGVTYATGFVLFTTGMALSGVVVTTAVVRLSMVLPILAAVFIWSEAPTGLQTVGILLACASLPLLASQSSGVQAESGRRKDEGDKRKAKSGRGKAGRAMAAGGAGWASAGYLAPEGDPLELVSSESPASASARPGLALVALGLLFLNAGLSRLSMKAFNELCPPGEKPVYLVFLFATTALVYGVVCLRQRLLPTRRELLYGAAIGLCNVGGSGMFLAALDRVPAPIAFPVSSAGGLILTTLGGVFLLGERLDRKTMAGVVVGVLALVLVNLRR